MSGFYLYSPSSPSWCTWKQIHINIFGESVTSRGRREGVRSVGLLNDRLAKTSSFVRDRTLLLYSQNSPLGRVLNPS